MKAVRPVFFGLIGASVGLLGVMLALATGPAKDAIAEDRPAKKTKRTKPRIEDKYRLSLDAARAKAEVMYEVYSATLETMHHRYFHNSRAVVPARAMQDVFSTIQDQSKIEANWISVNTKAMSIDHKPKSDFEKRAAREIAAGKSKLEVIEDGYYRRAGVIPLSAGCVGCHTGFFRDQGKKPRFAGLVISVPVRKGETLPSK